MSSLVSDGISTLCIIQQYGEALTLFDTYVRDEKTAQGYLNKKDALELFSHTDRVNEYLFFLQRYAEADGNMDYLHYYTEPNFYQRHKLTINQTLNHERRTELSLKDSLIIVEFIKEDQAIRKDRLHSHEEKRVQDSLNQIPIKQLIAKKKYTNYPLRSALTLLLRHTTESYHTSFKASGELNFYRAHDVISLEEYYDAVSYISGDQYFNRKEFSDIETHELLNQKRAAKGLLPIRYSPLINRQNAIRIGIAKEEDLNYIYKTGELTKYLNKLCYK